MRLSFFAGMFALMCLYVSAAPASAADTRAPEAARTSFIKAEVLQIISQERRDIPGTGSQQDYQSIQAQLLEGADAGKILVLDNDYMLMQPGDEFFVMHLVDPSDGTDAYSVSEPYRLPVLAFFLLLFLACLFLFGGKQGLRGLLSLCASLLLIGFVLLPGILNGYSPLLVSMGVSSIIIIFGSYITHGRNKTTTSAVLGMLATILITGSLAYLAIHWGHFSGYTSEEVTYLNFSTTGSIDFVGLLLGSIMIGLLGVLYDAAISQAIAVEELLGVGAHLPRAEILRRALRIGREHIGALVNTLAIAYVGVSLPLLLLFQATSQQSPLIVINQELFAAELIRTMIGSIGLILAVPITTVITLYVLSRWPSDKKEKEHSYHRH